MSSAITVRIRFPVDDAVLSDLHARAFAHPDPPHPDPTHPVPTLPWAARLERHSLTWVGAFLDEELVGFVHACGDGGTHAFLLDTVVDPDHQRHGIGRRLVEALVDQVTAAGCEWLHVDHEPHLDGFYAACGFDQPTTARLKRLR